MKKTKYIIILKNGLPVPLKIARDMNDEEAAKYHEWEEIRELIQEFYLQRAEAWGKVEEDDYSKALEKGLSDNAANLYKELYGS